MSKLLSNLEKLGFIERYEDEVGKYLHIPNFKKHQKVHPNEAKSVIPNVIKCNLMVSQCQTMVGECSSSSSFSSTSTLTSTSNKEKETASPIVSQEIPFDEIIQDLNMRARTNYKSTTPPYRKKINARWSEGYRLADFQYVHAVKCEEWVGDSKMEKHLNPDILYSPSKFPKYLNQKPSTGLDDNQLELAKIMARRIERQKNEN